MQQIPTTKPTTLCDRVENGTEVTVVDVRQPHEFERNHIEHPNAHTVNVPLNQLQTVDPSKILDGLPTENVVAVCASGNRSSFATQVLNRAGIPAENLAFGMQGWQQAC